MKEIAIMQPYFLPYIGYFQLLNKVDEFVLYDNIEYTKKGWINRNRMLQNGKAEYFTLPLKKDSDFLNINQRFLAENSKLEIEKTLRKIKANYMKAPMFNSFFPIVEDIFLYNEKNLFSFILHSIQTMMEYIGISTPIIISSTLSEHVETLKSQEKVIQICKEMNADCYINPIGGVELYDKLTFQENGIELNFMQANNIHYPQFKNEFVPFLSILDVGMFNEKEEIQTLLNEYTLK